MPGRRNAASRTDVALIGTYLDSQSLIHRIVKTHVRRHGGDAEEAESESLVLFVNAYHEYDVSRGVPWETWLRMQIGRKLLTSRGKEVRREKILPRVEYDLEEREEQTGFDLDLFCEPLSKDAELVVRLVFKLYTPKLDPKQIKRLLEEQSQKLGWSKARTNRAFTEVKKQL